MRGLKSVADDLERGRGDAHGELDEGLSLAVVERGPGHLRGIESTRSALGTGLAEGVVGDLDALHQLYGYSVGPATGTTCSTCSPRRRIRAAACRRGERPGPPRPEHVPHGRGRDVRRGRGASFFRGSSSRSWAGGTDRHVPATGPCRIGPASRPRLMRRLRPGPGSIPARPRSFGPGPPPVLAALEERVVVEVERVRAEGGVAAARREPSRSREALSRASTLKPRAKTSGRGLGSKPALRNSDDWGKVAKGCTARGFSQIRPGSRWLRSACMKSNPRHAG